MEYENKNRNLLEHTDWVHSPIYIHDQCRFQGNSHLRHPVVWKGKLKYFSILVDVCIKDRMVIVFYHDQIPLIY